ncbi:unnamed protein product [Rhizoctonia solani]|uniref:F-box domain-containing protein n=1 Tax=Rhizoctonia solani TaxID=456999 RepID=A0A8H3HRR5_9AGAM|nr:unnamed protein product [Rhizoctonia solani]CAE6536715.1 unnamed protein product [Rhizoctonia solani]
MTNGSPASNTINHLPFETLTSIFRLVLLDGPHMRQKQIIAPNILKLISVCPHWRAVLFKNPLFWLSVPVGNRHSSGYVTQLYLKRSRNNPIDVMADFFHPIPNMWPSYELVRNWEGRQDLIDHAPRVRSLSVVSMSVEHVCSLLGSLPVQRLGLLTELSLSSRRGGDTFRRPWISAFSDLVPQLQKLCLHGATTHIFGESGTSYNFSQLRELLLDGHFSDDIAVPDTLLSSSSLQAIEFYGGCSSETNPTVEPVLELAQDVKLLRLHQLVLAKIRWGLGHITRGIWQTELWVLTSQYERLHGLPGLFTVVALSLENDEYGTPCRDVGELLRDLPNLRTLTLCDLILSKPVLSSMTRPSDSTGGDFARLEVLRLYSTQVADYEAFKSLISSHPIRRLEVWGSIEELFSPTVSPSFDQLREQVQEIHVYKRSIHTIGH